MYFRRLHEVVEGLAQPTRTILNFRDFLIYLVIKCNFFVAKLLLTVQDSLEWDRED